MTGTVLAIKYKLDAWNPDEPRNRNTFACLHYDRVTRMLKLKGTDADDVKATAKHWLGRAGAFWDTHRK